MRILGIDPGYGITGYSIIEYKDNIFKLKKAGAIITDAKVKYIDRLDEIRKKLTEVIEEFEPDVVAIEELFFNTNTTTGIKVAQARGVMLITAKMHNLEIYEYTPLQVKQAVCGYGRADKKQVQMMVKTILKIPGIPKLDDITDSMAVGICHGNSAHLNKLLDNNINSVNYDHKTMHKSYANIKSLNIKKKQKKK